MTMSVEQKLLILFLIGIAALYTAGLNHFLAFGDGGHYYLLAQSLAQGSGYTFIAGPQPSPDNAYPFVYPVLLVPFFLAAPWNFFAAKVLTLLFALFLAGTLFYCMPKLMRDRNASMAALFFALTPLVAMYSRMILSEIFFIFFSLGTLYYVDRFVRQNSGSVRNFVFAVVSFFLAYYTRTIGFTLLVATICFCIMQRQYKKGLILSAAFALVMSIWAIRFALVKLPSQYVNEAFSGIHTPFDLAHRIFYNAAATVGKEVPDLFFYPFFASIDPYEPFFIVKLFVGIVLVVLICTGFIRTIRCKGIGVVECFCLVYLAAYFCWTYHGNRLLLPVLPFFFYYSYVAVRQTGGRRLTIAAALSALVILSVGNSMTVMQERARPFNPEEESFVAAADWMKRNIPMTSIVMSKNSRWLFVYSHGLRGAALLQDPDVRKQEKYLKESAANYIVIDQTKIFRNDSREYLVPLVRAYPGRFSLVYESPREPVTRIYRVNR